MEDTFKHQGLRRQLIEEIKKKGIKDAKVMYAIAAVPRHYFMEKAFLEFAYQDKAFPIEAGQTISQPYTVAYQTQLLGIEKGQKVLEVGTGSGYQTCILCEMNAKVFSIERQKLLFDKTKKLLADMGYQAKLFYGDGFKGLPAFAPFDKIIITCGAAEIPTEILKQLKPGGVMVVPIGSLTEQVMTIVIKKNDDQIEIIELDKFRFVPMLENKVK